MKADEAKKLTENAIAKEAAANLAKENYDVQYNSIMKDIENAANKRLFKAEISIKKLGLKDLDKGLKKIKQRLTDDDYTYDITIRPIDDPPYDESLLIINWQTIC